MMVLKIDLEAPTPNFTPYGIGRKNRKEEGVAGIVRGVAGNGCGVGKVDEDAQPKKGRYRWRHSVLGLVRLCLRVYMCACICLCVRLCACVEKQKVTFVGAFAGGWIYIYIRLSVYLFLLKMECQKVHWRLTKNSYDNVLMYYREK